MYLEKFNVNLANEISSIPLSRMSLQYKYVCCVCVLYGPRTHIKRKRERECDQQVNVSRVHTVSLSIIHYLLCESEIFYQVSSVGYVKTAKVGTRPISTLFASIAKPECQMTELWVELAEVVKV